MKKGSTHVGMDVHKKDIAVAMLAPGSFEPVAWTVANEASAVRRLARRLARESGGEAVCAYEAGVCGYVLQRQLRGHGIACQVVAPSLMKRRPCGTCAGAARTPAATCSRRGSDC